MPQVLPGQRLRIAARDWNRVQAAADAVEAQRGGQQPGRGVGTILVRNTSDRDLAEFAVMCVSGVLVTPEANLAEFQFRWALDVDVPSADTLGQLVITQEPIKAGAVGRAVACGISPVQLLGELTGDTAGAVADKTTYLEAGGRGAQVLWAEDYVAPGVGETEEPRWALVRLPFDGGGCYQTEDLDFDAQSASEKSETVFSNWVELSQSYDVTEYALIGVRYAQSGNGAYAVGIERTPYAEIWQPEAKVNLYLCNASGETIIALQLAHCVGGGNWEGLAESVGTFMAQKAATQLIDPTYQIGVIDAYYPSRGHIITKAKLEYNASLPTGGTVTWFGGASSSLKLELVKK